MHTDSPKKRVVIVGGGFGGVFAAKYLRRYASDDIEVELINNQNYFVYQPLLPEVASGTINAQDAVAPLRLLLRGVKIRMAQVCNIDFQNKLVKLVQGSKRKLIAVPYDYLVLATGQKTDLTRLPGFPERSLTMKDLDDAFELRNHVIRCLEHADITEDMQLKQRLLTFAVAGGGFSGVETMGEMSEMIARALKFYPNIHPVELRSILVQKADRILPELPPKLSLYAHRQLERRGVEIRLETGVRSATAMAVELDDGTTIEAATLVTTIGNRPADVVTELPIELQRGRVPTDRHLRVETLDHVWAVGDMALIPLHGVGDSPSFAPPTAQFAVREARCVAGNIVAAIEGRSAQVFRYKPRGVLASIGHYKGVAEVFGIRISGLLGWLLWRALYIGMLPGFSTRLRVALNWLFDYFLPRNIVQISRRRRPACRFVHYAKGDVIFRPGQIIDGFYMVVSGALESTAVDEESGEESTRVLGPGDHWGERALTAGMLTVSTLSALKDTHLLVLDREDFAALRKSFKPLNEYFESIHETVYPRSLR